MEHELGVVEHKLGWVDHKLGVEWSMNWEWSGAPSNHDSLSLFNNAILSDLENFYCFRYLYHLAFRLTGTDSRNICGMIHILIVKNATIFLDNR